MPDMNHEKKSKEEPEDQSEQQGVKGLKEEVPAHVDHNGQVVFEKVNQALMLNINPKELAVLKDLKGRAGLVEQVVTQPVQNTGEGPIVMKNPGARNALNVHHQERGINRKQTNP